MARPIQLDFPARDRRAELQQRLADAPAEHAEAILDFLDLIEALHQNNVLSTLRGAVGAGDDLIGHIAQFASQPDSVRAMRNFLALTKLFGQLDPDLIAAIQRSIPAQFTDRCHDTPAPSLWKIARTFWSPPVRRALMATGFVLAGIGYYMSRETPGQMGCK
ncbi:MAG TPA: hypothetical protein VHZ09_20515 [Acidobacteriaceae bacterium]|jgi:uncharacterized protein YjgD (DUF1641 family)|nr:hypothetical protein [Acidobacteriaceae bacterium]